MKKYRKFIALSIFALAILARIFLPTVIGNNKLIVLLLIAAYIYFEISSYYLFFFSLILFILNYFFDIFNFFFLSETATYLMYLGFVILAITQYAKLVVKRLKN